jgi:hypothetical protein
MSIDLVAIAVVAMLASILDEFTVVSRFIAEQRPKQQGEQRREEF